MWNVKFEKYIKPLDLNLDWCVAVEIIMGTKKCVIFNVYMPYQSSDNVPSYFEKLGVIKAIILMNWTILAVLLLVIGIQTYGT